MFAEHLGCHSRHKSNGSGHCHDASVSCGMGLRKAARTSPAAFWASWETAFPWSEHDAPSARWETPVAPATLLAAQTVAGQLVGVEGFDPPSWEALADRQRPPRRDPDDSEPGDFRHVWQHEASSRSPVSRGAWAGKAGRTLGCAACMRSSFGKTATSEAGGRPSTMQFVVVSGANRG